MKIEQPCYLDAFHRNTVQLWWKGEKKEGFSLERQKSTTEEKATVPETNMVNASNVLNYRTMAWDRSNR